MSEKKTIIPARLQSGVVGGYVTGAADIIDDAKGQDQARINANNDASIADIYASIGDDSTSGTVKGRIKQLENEVGPGGSVDTRIKAAVDALDSSKSDTSDDGKVSVSVTETDGKLTEVNVSTNDIASAATVAQHKQALDQDIAAINGKISENASASNKLMDKAYIDSNLSAEVQRATNAEQANATAISNEATRAQGAEATLQANIGAEETRAKAAEKHNADDIDVIESKIPSAATPQNQLADKEFVNSSIATATATFRGTYNSLAELQAVTGVDNNDYGFVRTVDSVGNVVYNKYKFDGIQWVFEYALNNSSFTAEQWAAINSELTSGHKNKLDALPTNAELTEALNSKQPNILDLDTIRSGAASGATAYQKPDSGIPKSDLSDTVKSSLEKADTAIQDISGKADKATTLAGYGIGNAYTKLEVDNALSGKQNNLTFDDAPTENSSNPVKSGGIKAALNEKQDNISDLSDIRSGAASGATAYQKPSEGIPENHLDSSTQSKINAGGTAYQKPEGGIPKNDLEESVKTSLGNADTAIQPSALDDYYTKTESDALLADKADSSNVYTKAEADNLISDKQDTLESGMNIKTINGSTVLGSGDLIINTTGIASDADPLMDGEASAGVSTEYSRGDHRHPSDDTKQDVLVFATVEESINAANELT